MKLNSVQNAEVSDTTEDEQRSKAGNKKSKIVLCYRLDFKDKKIDQKYVNQKGKSPKSRIF